MSTRRRTWLVLGLTVVLVAAFTADLLHQVLLRRAAAIDSGIQNGPLTISLRIDGRNVTGSGWQLRLDPAGNETLKINSYPTPKTGRFVVSKAQLGELRKALLREHFFDLADSYGEGVVDGGHTTFQVCAGGRTKTVNLYDLKDRTRDEREQLSEPSRALRVLQVVLAWFNDPELNEMRKWDQKLIDAAGKK